MKKQIGDQVSLNGKQYTISGFHKRSYLLKDAAGKEYKCGPDKLDRIEAGIPRQARAASPSVALRYFEKAISFAKLFPNHGHPVSAFVQMPNKETAQAWIDRIENELSPENLHCDGEISHAAAMKKQRELNAALAYCLKVLE
jgi:hypothetical protein